jgi:hypothetical protein
MTPEISASVSSASVGVGDPFAYVVEARGTGPVRVTADTGAFTAVAAPRVERSHDGSAEVVRVTQRLVCLDRGCAPGASPRRVSLPEAHVLTADGAATARARQLAVVPRVPAKAVVASRAAYEKQVEVPGASTRLPPGVLAALLIAAAVVLVLAAAALVVRGLPHRAGRAARSLGLADALRLLRESAGRPAADRRRAADFAGVLAGGAARDEATRLAWAPPDPAADEVGALADHIEAGAG